MSGFFIQLGAVSSGCTSERGPAGHGPNGNTRDTAHTAFGLGPRGDLPAAADPITPMPLHGSWWCKGGRGRRAKGTRAAEHGARWRAACAHARSTPATHQRIGACAHPDGRPRTRTTHPVLRCAHPRPSHGRRHGCREPAGVDGRAGGGSRHGKQQAGPGRRRAEAPLLHRQPRAPAMFTVRALFIRLLHLIR